MVTAVDFDIMVHFLLKISPKFSLQSEKVIFSNGWWGIGEGVISGHNLGNYQHILIDLLEFLVGLNRPSQEFPCISSTAKSSKTAENYSMGNELETTAYLALKWQ